MKELSIIIPHKNSVSTLGRLIQSIPESDSIEIIIIDDHSDEDVKFELEIFCAKNQLIRLFENPAAVGSAGTARNIGLQYAVGKWILFADADDYFLDTFAKQVEKHLKSAADIIYFKPKIVVNDDSFGCLTMIKSFDIYESKPSEDNLLLLKLHMVTPWSKLIKRDLIVNNGLCFDEVQKNNDTMFSLKIALSTERVEIDQLPIYSYSVHSFSLTKQTDLNCYYSVVDVHARAIIFLRDRIPKKQLLEVNPEAFYTHYRLLYYGLREYRSIKIIINVLRIYRKNGLVKRKYFPLFLAISGFYKKKQLFRQ